MDGIHDLGGRQGFGKVDAGEKVGDASLAGGSGKWGGSGRAWTPIRNSTYTGLGTSGGST